MGQRLRERCRRYFRGLVIAGSVAMRQVGSDVNSSPREHPPFVQLLEETPEQFSERERVGRWVLTTKLKVPTDDDRMTGNQN